MADLFAIMNKLPSYCPHWAWWIRTGERISLGLGVVVALEGSNQQPGERVRLGLRRARDSMDQGEAVAESLRQSGMRLPTEAWCLLDAGERSGHTGEAMVQIGALIRARESRRRALVGQLWYPVIVMVTGLAVMGIILLWVVPQMRLISDSMGQGGQLPWITEHIDTLYGGIFLGALGGGCIAITIAFSLSLIGRHSIVGAALQEGIMGRIPVLGKIRAGRREGRILRQLGTLLGAGITLAEGLRMAARGSPDVWEKETILRFRERLLMGSPIADCLTDFPIVDRAHVALLMTGQETGQFDLYLNNVAEEIDTALSWRVKQLMIVIEPVTIFGLALAIGGLVLAYLLPMVQLLEQLA